jgi:hypothetical protein
VFARPAFPLPVALDGRGPLGVNAQLHTPPLPATHVSAGTNPDTDTAAVVLVMADPGERVCADGELVRGLVAAGHPAQEMFRVPDWWREGERP